MVASEDSFRQAAFAGTAGVLRTGSAFHLPEREDFGRHIDRVHHVAALVRRPSLNVDTLRSFWRGGARARQTVETHAHHLELNLEHILHSVEEKVSQADDLSLVEFTNELVPAIMQHIDSITPADLSRLDDEDAILECHYAVSIRAALLQYVLVSVNRRYAKPDFESLRDAEAWTTTFGRLLSEVGAVMEGTRSLLQQEVGLTRRFLQRQRAQLQRLEKRLRIHAPDVGPMPAWEDTFDSAETAILESLSAWSDRLEDAAFNELADRRSGGGLLETVGQSVIRHAPQIGIGIVALAAGATGASMTREAPALTLPEPIRTGIDGAGSQFGTRENGVDVAVPAIEQNDDVGQIDTLRSAMQSGTNRIASIFDALPLGPGEGREIRVETPAQLDAALADLATQGYDQNEVLGAMGLESADQLSEPVTLELRADETGTTELLVPEIGANYEVQRGDTMAGIARRFGLSLEQLRAENPGIDDPNVIEVGQMLRVPATQLSNDRVADEMQIPRGASLAEVATELGVSVDELARLNRIQAPDTWRYTGQELTLPMRVLDDAGVAIDTGTGGAASNEQADASTTTPARPAVESTGVSREREIFTLNFGTTGSETNAAGESRPATERTTSERRSTTAAVASSTLDGDAIVAKYGSQIFPSLDAMPADARAYFTSTVQEIADFFNVRPGDIMGILRAENNDTGWRLYQPAVSSAGARGVGQFVPRTWNGWSNPNNHTRHLTNMAEIVTHSGLGFDWSKRDVWKAWKAGEVPKSTLEDSNADPMIFENNVAAIARHLEHWGLTRDAAEERPDWFEDRLADAIAVYNSGSVLSKSANFTQSAANTKTVAEYVDGAMATSDAVTGDFTTTDLLSTDTRRALFDRVDLLYDATFGVDLSDHELERMLAEQAMLLSDLDAGKLTTEQTALQFLDVIEQHYLAQGRAARDAGERVPWPYVHNRETLLGQKLAVSQLGHMLDAREVQELVEGTRGDVEAMRKRLASRADAQLVSTARERMRELLGAGTPVRNSDVTALVQPLVAGKDPYQVDAGTLAQLQAQLEQRIDDTYQQQRKGPIAAFESAPLKPMPRVVKAFGVPVNYQQGGKHTGIDIALPRGADGKEPSLYAVADGKVEYVGPLYCDAPRKCRGDQALIIDHGDNVYSIYSHNSETIVRKGEQVKAGQMVGRQGNEGFSYGSHLHFEVHVGAPFTGNWRTPWTGGEFVDPMDYINT